MDYNVLSLDLFIVGTLGALIGILYYLIISTKSIIKDFITVSIFFAIFGFITLICNGGIQLSIFNNNDCNGLMVFTKDSVYNELQTVFTKGQPLKDIHITKNTFIVFDCE